MSHEVAGGIEVSLPAGGEHALGGDEHHPEATAAVVAQAEILAGRVPTPVLPTPPEVEAFLARESQGWHPPATPEAVRHITEQLSLQVIYRGEPVVYFTTAAGNLSVLAAGEAEIRALLAGLSDRDLARVVLTDTMP